MSDRESLGRLVRDVWVTTATELLAVPKPSWLVPWEELDDEFQREVDMRIGEAVAAAERERVRQLAIRVQAHYYPVPRREDRRPLLFADLLTEGEPGERPR